MVSQVSRRGGWQALALAGFVLAGCSGAGADAKRLSPPQWLVGEWTGPASGQPLWFLVGADGTFQVNLFGAGLFDYSEVRSDQAVAEGWVAEEGTTDGSWRIHLTKKGAEVIDFSFTRAGENQVDWAGGGMRSRLHRVGFEPPGRPGGLHVAGADGRVSASWDAVELEAKGGYRIELRALPDGEASAVTLAPEQRRHSFGGLTDGTEYAVSVFAVSPAGVDSEPAVGTATPTPIRTGEWFALEAPRFSGLIADASHFSRRVLAFAELSPWFAHLDAHDDDGGRVDLLRYREVWERTSQARFDLARATSPSLAVSDRGTPYLAFASWTDLDGPVGPTVIRDDGQGWSAVGGGPVTEGPAFHPLVALDASGAPVVAWRTAPEGPARVARFVELEGWRALGGPAGAIGGEPAGRALDFVLDGETPVVAFVEAGTKRVRVERYEGAQGWQPVGEAPFADRQARGVAIAAAAGSVWVAFSGTGHVGESDGRQAWVWRWDGAVWSAVGEVPAQPESVADVSLALASGAPRLAFRGGSGGDEARVLRFAGGAWAQVGPALPGAGDELQLVTGDGELFLGWLEYDGSGYGRATVMGLRP